MKKQWLQPAGILFGIAAAASMLFASQLGLDNNPVWGVRRYAVFFMGLAILLVSSFYREDNFIGKALHSADGRFYATVVLLDIAIVFIYLWFASDGMWTTLPNETNYYDLQANAFAKGQLELDVQPDPALLAFKDESLYEPANREGIPVLWDATLYKGKYHLYWGPAPALLLALIKPFHPSDLGDKVLTLLFISGTLLFLTLTILELWRSHFNHIPRGTVLAAIAFAGLVNPMPYIMTEGRIYEAAIVAAQFFLMGGFYFLLPAFNRPSIPRLALAGLFFTLAVGSRTTLIPAVGILSLVVLLWTVQTRHPRAVSYMLAFALPLALGAVGYGWYNHARFDSTTEFGYRYQLTSYNLYQQIGETFALEYLPPNLYKTLFNPLERRDAFPYIFPTRWSGPGWLTNYQPKMYLTYTENITGIFIASPFLLLAALAGIRPKRDLRWMLPALSAAFLAVFVTLQAFFFVAMRYMLDAVPTLALLSVIGFWHGFDLFKNSKAYSLAAALLLIYSIAVSLLISFSGNLELFKIHNPELVRQMTWTFNSLFK
ncbi:MAG: hypothetical protein DPW18_15325 [Chloroflexi bacterium]|nr:hypothetical protein [Chloroflexota bacterium]MDL1943371.1 hypothetical protein [Chloroflexi bacterium CFX2]